MSGTDVSGANADQPVGITGLNGSGVPTTPVNATQNGELTNADILNAAAAQKTISLTTTIVAAQTGTGNLVNRKLLLIYALTAKVQYGFSASSTPFPLANGSVFSLALGANITVYLSVTSGTGSVEIAELA